MRSAGAEHLRDRCEHDCLSRFEPEWTAPPRRRALSDAVYRECAEVLTRPKFARVLTEDRRREFLELLSVAALWVEPKEKVQDRRDGKDNPYLELALAAGATAIVSGDEDLLVLNPWRGVQVLRPATFLAELRISEP